MCNDFDQEQLCYEGEADLTAENISRMRIREERGEEGTIWWRAHKKDAEQCLQYLSVYADRSASWWIKRGH